MKVRVLVVGCVLALTMGACGGSESTETSADAPDTLLDAIPTAVPERPTDVRTDVGAAKFSAHVFDIVFYVLATNDVKALQSIADKKACGTCENLALNMKQRPDRVQVGTEPHRVSEPEIAIHKGDRYTVNQQVRFPSGAEIIKKTGKEFKKLDGREIEMNVELQWRKGKWVLLNYKAATNK